MIIWKGVNIFPNQIESVLMGVKEMEGAYLVILETENDVDTMTVQVETREDFLRGDKGQALGNRIGDSLQSELLVRPQVKLVPPGTIPLSETAKAKRVIDRRSG